MKYDFQTKPLVENNGNSLKINGFNEIANCTIHLFAVGFNQRIEKKSLHWL